MSEVNTNANTNDAEETKSTLDIHIDQHLKYEGISYGKYTSNVEFCETVSKVFGSVFPDWEGCKLERIPNTQQLQFKFFFNHRNNVVPGMYNAVTKNGVNTTVNPTLAAIRQRDNLLVNGDRYTLTEDGKSGLRKFLIDAGSLLFDKMGNPKWDKITSEVSNNNSSMFSQQIPQQLTCVSYIDPAKIAAFLYGTEVDGDKWVYAVSEVRSIATPTFGFSNPTNNMLLFINRISEEQTRKLAAMYGLVITNGLGIIK